jgi:RimJ/RimL family protein N-acetyltransferase
MHDIHTPFPGLLLVRPDPERDAPFAFAWFKSPYGKETLLLMGNAEHAINVPTLEQEGDRIREFLQLEKTNKQLTWMIRYNDQTIGAVWIELVDSEHVASPAVHIMIGDKSYRGKGIGKTVIEEMIRYAKEILKANTLHSRYLVNNVGIAHLMQALGFIKDGQPYKDTGGLEFQNIMLDLS